MTLPPDFLQRLSALLTPHLRAAATREALVDEAYNAAPRLREQLNTAGTPRDVAAHIIQTALDFGCLDDGRHALVPLMIALKTRGGTEQADALDALIDAVQPLCELTARAAELRYLLRLGGQIGADADNRPPQRAVLVGDLPATTRAAQRIVRRRIADASADADAPLPVVIRLGEWTDQRSTLKSLIRAALDVTDARLDTLIRRGRIAAVLLDADLLPNKARLQTIRDFARDYPALSLIITQRDADDLETWEGDMERISVR
jgi:hypothetical protein